MAPPFIHPQALCEATEVGDDTRIWAFAYVLAGARIGRDVNVCSHVFIEGEVVVGDRVTIKSGVQLWDGVVVRAGLLSSQFTAQAVGSVVLPWSKR